MLNAIVMENRAIVAGRRSDPLVMCTALAVLFFLISLIRFAVPHGFLFDEAYYVPAARELLSGAKVINREHPMLGKEILAASIALFGDNPLGWRAPSLVLMPAALLLAMQAMWEFTKDQRVVLLFGMLIVTGCLFNVLGRVGTLDAPMLFFAAAAAYFFACDDDQPSSARLACCAIALGLSLACKWTIAPLLPIVALAWACRRGLSVKSVAWAGLWFGALPVLAYLLTFAPAFLVRENPLRLAQLLPLQFDMARAISGYENPNPYPSMWWQWLANTGPFYALAADIEGAWRLIVLTVNPVSAPLAVGAVGWAISRLAYGQDRSLVWLVTLFAAPVLMAALGGRMVFVHHYAISLVCGFALLAMLTPQLGRWAPWGLAAACSLAFVWLFPILTAAPLQDRAAAARYATILRRDFVDWGKWAAVHRGKPRPEWARLQGCLDRPGTC